MYRSKVFFILRGHVWYVTRIFLWLLFILVGEIYPPMHARAFSLTSFETQSSSCDYIRVSGRLIYSPKCLLDLNNWKRFSFVRDCYGFLQCFVMLGPARYSFLFVFFWCSVKFSLIVINRQKNWSVPLSSFPRLRRTNILLVNYDSWWQHQMLVRELRHDRPSGRFSKSRGLSASVSFLSSPPPPRSFTCAKN